MLEFMIFDVHGQFKTLDDTELTKLLFVYCGFNGTKLDQQLASFKGLLAGKKCDLSNFMLVSFTSTCHYETPAFAVS